jgi:hypothetical protein
VQWATGDADTHVVPHTSQARAAYATYAGAVVRRYGAAGTFWTANPNIPAIPITAVEVWNEPWYPGPTDPAVYTALVKTASVAIHAAQPTIAVLANVDNRYRTFGNGKSGIWMTAVLDSAANLDSWVDGWSIHPYPRDMRVTPAKQAADSIAQVQSLHDELARRTLRGAIWVTEIAFRDRASTLNPLDTYASSAASLTSLVRGAAGMGGANPVAAIYAFTTAREPAIPNQAAWDYGYNLFTATGQPKPALTAFAQSTVGASVQAYK